MNLDPTLTFQPTGFIACKRTNISHSDLTITIWISTCWYTNTINTCIVRLSIWNTILYASIPVRNLTSRYFRSSLTVPIFECTAFVIYGEVSIMVMINKSGKWLKLRYRKRGVNNWNLVRLSSESFGISQNLSETFGIFQKFVPKKSCCLPLDRKLIEVTETGWGIPWWQIFQEIKIIKTHGQGATKHSEHLFG